MKIRLMRNGGNKKITVPGSRNPNGQYEDSGWENNEPERAGSYTVLAHPINRFTPVTEADRVLAQRISSGSQT